MSLGNRQRLLGIEEDSGAEAPWTWSLLRSWPAPRATRVGGDPDSEILLDPGDPLSRPQPRERVPGGCDSEPEAPPPRRWGRGRAERILSLQAATQGRGGLPA